MYYRTSKRGVCCLSTPQARETNDTFKLRPTAKTSISLKKSTAEKSSENTKAVSWHIVRLVKSKGVFPKNVQF